jgi:hypothetical protein
MSRAERSETNEAPTPPSGELLEAELLLTRAAALVESGWSQQPFAEDRHGRAVEPWSEGASRWSPLGALIKVAREDDDGWEVFQLAQEALALATGGRLAEWNAARWRTKWHVLSAFARARSFLPQAQEQLTAARERR